MLTIHENDDDKSHLILLIVGGFQQDIDVLLQLVPEHSLPVYFHLAFVILVEFTSKGLFDEIINRMDMHLDLLAPVV